MELKKLTKNIYYLPHEPEVDRPMLAYVKGEKYSLAIDAGYSFCHVKDFYEAIELNKFKIPDFTVITHWHYDHTFGMHAIKGVSIAHGKTNEFLKEQQKQAQDSHYIDVLKKEDIHFRKEYDKCDCLNIVFSDTTCIYVPEEKVLFLGDSTSEDFFNDGCMDKDKLNSLIQTIRSIDCQYCVLSHCEPLEKEDLLYYLESVI